MAACESLVVDLRLDGGLAGRRLPRLLIYQDGKRWAPCPTPIESSTRKAAGQYQANYTSSYGDSTVNSIGFQYTFSLAAFLRRPQEWWGQARTSTIQVFGMYNSISGLAASDEQTMAALGKSKLKLGTQCSTRPDIHVGEVFGSTSVQPNMDDRTTTSGFSLPG